MATFPLFSFSTISSASSFCLIYNLSSPCSPCLFFQTTLLLRLRLFLKPFMLLWVQPRPAFFIFYLPWYLLFKSHQSSTLLIFSPSFFPFSSQSSSRSANPLLHLPFLSWPSCLFPTTCCVIFSCWHPPLHAWMCIINHVFHLLFSECLCTDAEYLKSTHSGSCLIFRWRYAMKTSHRAKVVSTESECGFPFH